jgi:heavy metal translocating P-type ATPase
VTAAGPRALRIQAAAIPLATILVILIGLALQAGPSAAWGLRIWQIGLIALGLPVVWSTVVGAFQGRLAADLVASLAVMTAVILRQPLAGLVVVLMQTGGEALERYAAGRASRAVEELEAAAPRRANRLRDGGVEELPAERVQLHDRLLVRAGEMVPCDGVVLEGYSHIDESRLTGEPIPISAEPGTNLMSGSLNLEGPLTIEALALASESQYAKIVQLVRSAQSSKSPLQRMADRYAIAFTPITLAVCLLTWLVSASPIRVLAVLVVATPCPLILAVPVAMIGGINRAARRSIIIRHGEALERLGQATAVLLDKTGTLTVGRPAVTTVLPVNPYTADQILGYAAAVDAGAGHMLARSIVDAGAERGIPIPSAHRVQEFPGQGVIGVVDGHRIVLGSRSFIAARHSDLPHGWPESGPPRLRAWLAVDERPGGIIEFADRLRPEAHDLVKRLRKLGIRHIVLVTGDHEDFARTIAQALDVPEVRANLLPADKVHVVEEFEMAGERVLMVGDGTNDAPALTRASVGVALAAHGGGITAEAADAVVLADDASRVAEAITISRRTMGIARQSVWTGLGLSGLAMVFAAFGHIPPTLGAILQEVIDVAVILNALRASSDNILPPAVHQPPFPTSFSLPPGAPTLT